MSEPVIGKLARQIGAGGVFSAWIGWNEAGIAGALAEDFDCVMLDMQHGGFDFVGVTRAILAAALAGKPTVARIPVGDFATASRVIDAGAAGVIAPMVNSAADARRFVEFMKYPPLGGRSWGPRACLGLSGLAGPDYLHGANAITLAIAMVETREALDALDEIVATPGIDGVFVGPSDLSIGLSGGGGVDPRGAAVASALTKVAASVAAHGKFAGLFCFDGAQAKAARAQGFAFTSISTDAMLIRAAARAELEQARGA